MTDKRVRCFVMMPSGTHGEYERGEIESDFVYNYIIAQAIKNVYGDNAEIIREVDSQIPGAVDRSIVSNIVQSDIAIVDITGHNPNVFLELGMRYGLRRNTTILLRQEHTTVPFDVANYRCVSYSVIFNGPAKSVEKLEIALREAKSNSTVSDSLVYDVFPNLRIENNAGSGTLAQGVMPWDHYWQRVTDITQRLQIPTRGTVGFKPDVVLGISNGGMIFADLLVRNFHLNEVYTRHSEHEASYKSQPIAVWSLWADRDADGERETFDSLPNRAILTATLDWIKNKNIQDKHATILIADDIVATGFTSLAAIRYVNSIFQELDTNTDVYFLPLFNKDIKINYGKIEKYLVWNHEAFQYDITEIQKAHYTDYTKLPYLKDLR